jgi:hypothetical protein
MERWYRRAIEADPTMDATLEAKLEYLEPKWHGSEQEMLAFGRELLKDGNWESRQPLKLVDVHLQLVMTERVGVGGNYYDRCAAYFKRHPEAWADVKAVYDGYLERVPDSRYHRTRYAVIAAWCGEWLEADRQFQALGERVASVYPQEVWQKLRDEAATKAAEVEKAVK